MSGNIRWLAQRHRSTCGPVALVNIEKFLGKPSRLEYWNRRTKWKPERGTYFDDWKPCLDSIKDCRIIRLWKPTVAKIANAIDDGSIVLIRCAYTNPESHFGISGHYLIVSDVKSIRRFGMKCKALRCINVAATGKYEHVWLDERYFRFAYMQRHRILGGVSPCVWVVSKLLPARNLLS